MSERKISSVGVFCGSGGGTRPQYIEAATELGGLLAAGSLRLVYGGGGLSKNGKPGMMGSVADACLAGGGSVTGVIPTFLAGFENAHPGVSDMRFVGTMAERKDVLIAESDAFVILPGGIGTLDELFEVVTWNQLKMMDKPVLVVNTQGVFDGLAAWYERAVSEQFVPADGGGVPVFVSTPAEAVERLIDKA